MSRTFLQSKTLGILLKKNVGARGLIYIKKNIYKEPVVSCPELRNSAGIYA
jgi:hypothetical protein